MPERNEQIVVIDAGNSNTVFGVYRGGRLIDSLRLATQRERTADEYGALLLPLLGRLGLEPVETTAVWVSSVVPPVAGALEELARRYLDCPVSFIDAATDTGMEVSVDHPDEVGADRIVNGVAARHRYGCPVVVVDFGTATTFDVVDAEGRYVGGVIAPGIVIAAEALFTRTSRLHRVTIRRPPALIGRTTAVAVQSGIFYGYVGLVDGILERLRAELPALRKVVATGGQAEIIAAESRSIETVDPGLTLEGLRLIHERQRRP